MRHSKLIAIVVAVVVAVVVAALPFAAAAAAPATAQVVAVLSGRAPIRAKITRVLKQGGIRVVPGNQVAKTLWNESSPASEGDWARIAAKLGVDALVSVNATAGGIEIVIRRGTDGAIAGRETVSARVRPKQMGVLLAAAVSKRGASSIAQAVPSPAEQPGGGLASAEVSAPADAKAVAVEPAAIPPPPPATPPAERERKVASAGSGDATVAKDKGSAAAGADAVVNREGAAGRLFEGAVGRLSTFDIEADARTLRRTFDYGGGGGGRRYLLSFNPVAGARASYYPVRYAGVFAAGEFGAGLETGPYPTGTRELMGGAQLRIPLSFGQVGASAAYFHHAFLVQDTPSGTDPSRLILAIPNTVYGGVRLSASAQIALAHRIQVAVDGAYRLVTTVGDNLGEVRSQAYFPGSSSPYGLDGRAFVGVGVGSMLELRAGLDYRRYVYSGLEGTTANGIAIKAASAVDQYFAISLGVAAVLGPK